MYDTSPLSLMYVRTEYLSMLLNLEYSLKCDAFIGTLASNWCRLVDEMRATVGAYVHVCIYVCTFICRYMNVHAYVYTCLRMFIFCVNVFVCAYWLYQLFLIFPFSFIIDVSRTNTSLIHHLIVKTQINTHFFFKSCFFIRYGSSKTVY
jgi:hypothetical protein